MRAANQLYRYSLFLVSALTLSACNLMGGDSGDDEVKEADTSGVPSIWGDPIKTAIVSTSYSFVPEVSDSDGDVLEFAIANKPGWAEFDSFSGQLSGTPTNDDIGTDENIIISVSDNDSIISLASFSIRVSLTASAEDDPGASTASSQPPTLSGTPNLSAIVDNMYSFEPDASDPDSDPLSFSVIHKPRWASFDTTTGHLAGRPGDIDLGVTGDIELTVNDGYNVAGLNRFSISVEATGNSAYTLAWSAPTENEDGSPLTDLAGYRVYFGTSPGDYSDVVELNSGGITNYVLDNLAPGEYYLVMTSVNSSDMESDFTPEIRFALGS